MEYNEMNKNKKTVISVHQDGRQLLVIHARLLEAKSCINNLCCPRRERIICPFASLLLQQIYLHNMNWVSSVDKLAHSLEFFS
jgi:hypothetical protein